VSDRPIVVGGGGLMITPETYHRDRRHHKIADAVMERLGYDSNNVAEIRITETLIEVDVVDRTRSSYSITTHRHARGDS
jgi:hypothetical protein